MTETVKSWARALRERSSALVIGWSLAAVSAATGFISYTHICALTVYEGQSWKSAHLYPLAVDGQIAIGSVILMEVKGPRRWWGLVGFVPGLGESLIANWASGWAGHNYGAALWATVPAQAFACSMFLFELWMRFRRSRRRPAASAPAAETASLMAQLGYAGLAPAPDVAPRAALPAPEPAALPLVHVHAAPAEPPWGIGSRPAAAPAAPERVKTGPALDLSMLVPAGPVARVNGSRPAVRRPPLADAGPDLRLPLPSGEELRRVLLAASRNEIFRTYGVSKGRASELKKAAAAGDLEEMSEYAA